MDGALAKHIVLDQYDLLRIRSDSQHTCRRLVSQRRTASRDMRARRYLDRRRAIHHSRFASVRDPRPSRAVTEKQAAAHPESWILTNAPKAASKR